VKPIKLAIETKNAKPINYIYFIQKFTWPYKYSVFKKVRLCHI